MLDLSINHFTMYQFVYSVPLDSTHLLKLGYSLAEPILLRSVT